MPTELCPRLARVAQRGLVFALALIALQCGSTREDPTGGETHFFTCDTDDDCAWLSPSYSCAAGYCRSETSGAPTCATPAATANEVVVLGDSFFAASHRITGFLEEQARERGAIAAGERYRDGSSVVGNTLALSGPGIEAQYAAASAESPIEVVVMTGGGADVLLGSCETIAADCELFTAADAAARALFQRMAGDGVSLLIYAFYPDPADPELRRKVDALRPLLETACQESPVSCRWVDLRESFAGQSPELLDASGTVPSVEGARAAAQQIADVLFEQCAPAK